MLIDNRNPYRQTIRKLTHQELRHFARLLPNALSVWVCDGARFEVYRPKHLLNPHWSSDTLLRLLIDARGSYYVYGDRPPLDEYDAKSAPYLVRAVYSHHENERELELEEWISDRLVPLSGWPKDSGELGFFLHRGNSIDFWLQEKFFDRPPSDSYRFFTVTSNRLCGIPPYAGNERTEKAALTLPSRLSYTGIGYVLICYHFLEDYLYLSEARFSTSIIHNKVLQKSMTFANGLAVEFTPAWQLLGLAEPDEIRLNRKTHDLTAYRFPHYFLNTAALTACLKRLFSEGVISAHTLHRYCGATVGRDGAVDQPFEKMRYLGRLLAADGLIEGSSISGSELRAVIDSEVPDGPELKISTIAAIKENTERLISSLNIRRMA